MRSPVKGEPDFHLMSEAKVSSFKELTQQLMFSYKYHDEEKYKVLKDIWKDLSDEEASRVPEVGAPASSKFRKAPSIRKSPVSK